MSGTDALPRYIALATAIALLLVLMAAGGVQAASATLPGGTSISATITDPADGGVVAPGAPVTVSGTASVGEGVDEADTTIAYVVDVSSSTQTNVGCGANQNPTQDSLFNSVLDCELLAAITLNQDAIAAGSVAEVGVAAYGGQTTSGTPQDGHAADMTPGPSADLLTSPDADLDGDGQLDVERVLRSMRIAQGVTQFTPRPPTGGLTNFAAGVQAACSIINTSATGTNLVAFLSDGVPTAGPPAVNALSNCTNPVTFETFAVGSGASCTNTGGGRSSLQQIAEATGGTCRFVPNASSLPDLFRELVASSLDRLELSVDGGTPTVIPAADLSTALPASGPTSVSYATEVTGLSQGAHEICVSAHGTDAGGAGSVTDCVDITVNSPPDCAQAVASPPTLWTPTHRMEPVTILGVTDPDGDALTLTVTSIRQDEPVRGPGAGNTSPDGSGVGTDTAQVRAERSGTGDGRVYHVGFSADDGNGGNCTGTVLVTVPHSNNGRPAVDQGPLYDSTAP